MPGKETIESVVIEKKPNKSRLAFQLRYLKDHTDEDHALSIYEIMDAMEQNGYGKVTRKTATDDIQSLKDNGFKIFVDDGGSSNQYFYDGRSFQVSELKLLLDAVDAAAFIDTKEADRLSEKIIAQASSFDQEKLHLEHAANSSRISSSKIMR